MAAWASLGMERAANTTQTTRGPQRSTLSLSNTNVFFSPGFSAPVNHIEVELKKQDLNKLFWIGSQLSHFLLSSHFQG
jgi:hypothetical protein